MNTKVNDKIFDAFPNLESERLIFREFNQNDSSDIFLIKSDDRVMKYMDSFKHKSMEESSKMIAESEKMYQEKNGINWAIVEKSTDELIGYFGFWRLIRKHCRAEIGYSLKYDFWGKGLMKETLGVMLNFAFNEFCLHSLEANVNPYNENSKKMLLKLGFKQEAHFKEDFLFNGEFKDSFIFSLLETDV